MPLPSWGRERESELDLDYLERRFWGQSLSRRLRFSGGGRERTTRLSDFDTAIRGLSIICTTGYTESRELKLDLDFLI